MHNNEAFEYSFSVTVYGLAVESRNIFRNKYPSSAGGANPSTLVPYNSVRCELIEIENTLEFVKKNLEGSFDSIRIGISVSSKLNWSEILIPKEIISAAEKYNAEIKVLFSARV